MEQQLVTRRSFLNAVIASGSYVDSLARDCVAGTTDAYPVIKDEKRVRVVTDSLGRTIGVPVTASNVAPARPAVQEYLLAIAPEKTAALAYEPKGAVARARTRSDEMMVGALFDRAAKGMSVSLRQSGIDLLVDVENDSSWAANTASSLEQKAGVPLYTAQRSVKRLSQTLTDLGDLLGTARGRELGQYVATCLGNLKESVASISADEKPRVLFCNKNLGIEFGQGQRMLQREVIDLAGGIDALPAGCERSSYGQDIIPSKVDCDVIVAPDTKTAQLLFDKEDIRSLPWASHKAVLSKQVHCFEIEGATETRGVPLLAWSVVGVRWLDNKLHPTLFHFDLNSASKDYFDVFFPESENQKR